MRLAWMLVMSTVVLATDAQNTEGFRPCQIQQLRGKLRCVVPRDYNMRPGDCPGNDIWSLYRDRTTLKECARLCSTSPSCQAFMFYNNHRCYPKTKTCATATKTNPLNMFYDKVPRGFAMRPGDCSGNDIWSIHGFVSLIECARRCKANPSCVAFMFYDGRECYPKTRTCRTTDTANPKNFFYDKIAFLKV